MSGYMGQYCIINLSTGKSAIKKLDDSFYKKYLAGYGLGAAIISQLQKPKINPLSPESILGFCSGLLTGTGAYFAGRFMVVGKSPLTGGWGDSNCGGFFSVEIKRAGFDAIFVTGKSKKPVYIFINDGKILIKDAKKLWGKDTVETEELIKKELKDDKIQVACIGPSGEKLSLISGIVTDGGRIAARSGMGAVMGSKNLKAIAIKGTNKIPVARPDVLKEINRKFLNSFKSTSPIDKATVNMMNFLSQIIARTRVSVPTQPSTVREIFKRYGTCGTTVYSAFTGDTPIKNWAGVGYLDFPGVHKISDENVVAHQKKRYACQSCPLGCGGIVDIKEGRFKGTLGHKPEYETLGSFGGMLLLDDLNTIMEINELCNRAGIDTISAGATVAFAVECYEHGILTKKDTGGLELGWSRGREILALTEMIIQRKGLGNILADGVMRAAKKLGKGSEQYAMHAGGQELPMHDSRLDDGFAITYSSEATPGRHTIASNLYNSLYKTKKQFPKVKKMLQKASDATTRRITLTAASIYFANLFNGCGMCQFGFLSGSIPLVEYINAVTGWDLPADEYLTIGERILNVRKAFNVREGIYVKNTLIAPRAQGNPPLHEGPLKGVTIPLQELLNQFFTITGWDSTTGGPTESKLEELGIKELFSPDKK
ncbi:MAG: aldehyde ferredoxin oxidoreductase family protein [Spirochaetes bacterium]|nr:aldehyde ferredoxin oxidoreductase family protein [Spirochaetota bacterium]